MTFSPRAEEMVRRIDPGDLWMLPSPLDSPPKGNVPETLYHGTSVVRGCSILDSGGLDAGRHGATYFTDSFEVAAHYAIGTAIADLGLTRHPLNEPAEKLWSDATAQKGVCAVVFALKREFVEPLEIELDSGPMPLPWSTRRVFGGTYRRESRVPRAALTGAAILRVPQLDGIDEESLLERTARSVLAAPRHRREGWGAQFVGPMARALPEPVNLLLAAHYQNYAHPAHGWLHALGVAAAGARLLEAGAEADPAVLLAFAALHDSQRFSDGNDPDHGTRAALVAKDLRGDSHFLDDGQLELLCAALIDHDRGEVSDDPTIGACWDADRLTLPRVGIQPDPSLMSTPEGRRLTGELQRIPRPEECDWSWVRTRYHELALPIDDVRRWMRWERDLRALPQLPPVV